MDQSIIPEIVKHYLICALWSSVDSGGEPMDSVFSLDDIAEETKQKAREDVQDFLSLLHRENVHWHKFWSPEQFGHDFWLTRNCHGAGFWDRGRFGSDHRKMGEELTKWAKTYGEVSLYECDDGLIYQG